LKRAFVEALDLFHETLLFFLGIAVGGLAGCAGVTDRMGLGTRPATKVRPRLQQKLGVETGETGNTVAGHHRASAACSLRARRMPLDTTTAETARRASKPAGRRG